MSRAMTHSHRKNRKQHGAVKTAPATYSGTASGRARMPFWSTYAVVRRFLGDLHVMNVGLSHASTGDAYEFRLGAHLFDVGAAGVTHGRTQATHQLMDDRGQRTFIGNAAFDAFRYQLLGAFRGVLEVTVRRALRLGHCTQRTHAAVRLVRTTLEQFDFARSLFGTGEHRAHHHAGSTGNDGL